MRLGTFRRAAAISLASGIIGLAALPAPAALAATGGTPVALKSFSQMLVDQSHHVIIFADYQNGVLVTDMSGTTVATIPEPGTLRIALSPDSSTLYVAMGTSDTIAAINTSTWQQTALYPTGKNNDPGSIAVTGGRVWFSYGNRAAGTGGLGSIDPTAADPTPTLLPGHAGPLAASPADAGILVASFNTNPGSATDPDTLEVLDVSTGTPKVDVQAPANGIESLAISPDGQDVAAGYEGVLRISDLTRSSRYPAFPVGQGIHNMTFNPDGTLAFTADPTSTDINTYVETVGPNSGTLRTYAYPTSSADSLWLVGVGWDPSSGHLLALSAPGGPYQLLTLTDPEKADVLLSAQQTSPTQAVTGRPFTLPIAVRTGIPYAPGTVMHVTRVDTAHRQGVPLPDVPLDATGGFTIHDTIAIAGLTGYRLSIDADATHTAASTTVGVNIDAPTALTVTTNTSTYGYNAWAKVTAHLGPTYTNRSITLWVHPVGQRPWQIDTGTVDKNGNLSFSYPVTTNLTFTATYNGDTRSTPATATTPTVWDQAAVTDTLHGYYARVRQGGTVYDVFHRHAKVQLAVAVGPYKAGQTARIVIQQYYRGAWHTIKDIQGLKLGPASTTTYTTGLTGTNNTLYRAIAEYTGAPTDTTNINTWGTWQYLTLEN